MIRRLAILVVTCMPLAACGVGDLLDFGGGDEEVLPGSRISVLALERSLRPDIQAIDTQIRLPAPQDIGNWPMVGGFSHSAMHHMALGPAPRLLWRSDIGEGSWKRNRLVSSPVVADGRVFGMDSLGKVTAVDARNGNRLWRVDTTPDDEDDGAFLGGGLAVDGNRVIASGGFAEVVALSAQNGGQIWRTQVEAPIRSAPVLNSGRVFVSTVENQLIALAASDGRRLWSYSGISQATILLGGATPAVDGGVVIAAFTSGEIAALRADSGATLWTDTAVAVRRTEAAATLTDISARPVIDRGRIYIVGHTGILVAIDLRTGQRLWDVPVPGTKTPWIAGDFLYAVSVDAEVVCIDVRTGQMLWVTQLQRFEDIEDEEGRIQYTGPVLASDRLIVTSSDGRALSLSPYNGEVLGVEELRDPVNLPAVFANSTMYFLSDEGEILAYR